MSDVLRIAVPITLWLATFSAAYGLHGLVCSDRWTDATLDLATGRIVLIAAWLVAIAIQAALLLALRSARLGSCSHFVRGVSLTLAASALLATVWTLFPVAAASLCL